MSPEQARGDRNLDARVDLYACGIILYEALTGRRPFTAANYNALLLQILSAKPKPARDLRPALPSGFDAVLDKAIQRNREDRYRTAAEFQRDLQTLRDRHNASMPAELGEAIRAMNSAKAPAPPLPREPKGAARRAVAPPAPRAQRVKEPTPSSVEIPITFSNDTPLSGENIPVDATELESSRPPPPVTPSDAAEFEEYPTQVQVSPFGETRGEDAHTTQKRGPEFAQQLAQARVGVNDTDVTLKPVSVSDTDATGKPAALRAQRRASQEPRDDQDTIIRANAAFPLPKRKLQRRTPSPDDTIKVDSEAGGMEGDPTQLMPPRAPKVPRR
jgi:hypothetical protein